MYVRRRVNRRRGSYSRRLPKAKSRRVARYHSRRAVAIPRSPFGSKWKVALPTGSLVKFKYADTDFNMSTTVGGGYFVAYTFSGNCPFDPDSTGVGVQPYGWDPYSSLFNLYSCPASKIKVRFYTAESPVYKAVCTVVPAIATALGYQDPADLRVTPMAKQTIISSVEGVASRNHYITSYCSSRRVIPGQASNDTDFAAGWTASPTTRWYWHIYVDTSDQATEDSIFMDVQITYYTHCYKNSNNNES